MPPAHSLPRVLPSRSSILVSLLVIVLFNVPDWIANFFFFADRAVFSLDGVVAVAIGCKYRRLGSVLLPVVWLIGAVFPLSGTYHFHSPTDFILSSRFAGTLNVLHLFSYGDVVILLIYSVALLAIRRLQLQQTSFRAFAIAIMVLVTADALNGSSLLSDRDTRLLRWNLAGSPVAMIAKDAGSRSANNLRDASDPNSAALHHEVLNWAQNNPQGRIFVVVVESLGLVKNKRLQAWLENRLVGGIQQAVHSTSVSFFGSTTYGELRTLCLLKGNYEALTAEGGAGCLPAMLTSKGWRTSAYHGFSGKMFGRIRWWPKVGFQDIHFSEDMLSSAPPLCGAAFRGICDSSVLAKGASALGPSTLSYVLTLNTHLPLAGSDIEPELQALCLAGNVPEQPCTLIGALGKVLQEVRHQMDKHPEALLMVVGDHAPPFRDLASRRLFSEDHVPAWIIYPGLGKDHCSTNCPRALNQLSVP